MEEYQESYQEYLRPAEGEGADLEDETPSDEGGPDQAYWTGSAPVLAFTVTEKGWAMQSNMPVVPPQFLLSLVQFLAGALLVQLPNPQHQRDSVAVAKSKILIPGRNF